MQDVRHRFLGDMQNIILIFPVADFGSGFQYGTFRRIAKGNYRINLVIVWNLQEGRRCSRSTEATNMYRCLAPGSQDKISIAARHVGIARLHQVFVIRTTRYRSDVISGDCERAISRPSATSNIFSKSRISYQQYSSGCNCGDVQTGHFDAISKRLWNRFLAKLPNGAAWFDNFRNYRYCMKSQPRL
jgi:hypothetical protein